VTHHLTRRHRGGFTLIEMLVVMGALSVCLFLGTTLIVTTFKADRVGLVATNRVGERLELARQFRDDVSRAEAAPDQIGDAKAGPTCLILRLPDKTAVVYRWADDKLERTTRLDDQETKQLLPSGTAGTQVAFVRPKDAPGVVTLRVTVTKERGPAVASDVTAALGGNLR